MSSLIERIEHEIKEKGLTFKRVERDCGLGNGTIKRWAEQSPRLDKLTIVSDYLHVSIDYLVRGKEEAMRSRFEVYCDGKPLTESEADLVAMYRLLPVDHREEVFDIVHRKYTRLVAGGEKASIYSTYSDTRKDQESTPDQDEKNRSGIA